MIITESFVDVEVPGSGTMRTHVFKPNCDGKFAAVVVYSEIYQVCVCLTFDWGRSFVRLVRVTFDEVGQMLVLCERHLKRKVNCSIDFFHRPRGNLTQPGYWPHRISRYICRCQGADPGWDV